MRHRRSLELESLESRIALSHVHPLAVHHHHHAKIHHLANGQAEVQTHRPTHAAIHAQQADGASGFGGGQVDTTIPFVLATQVGGVAQNALNFTSNTYQGVLYGFEWPGIQQIASEFNQDQNVDELAANLTALSQRMPYGMSMLLPTWEADLKSLQAGTLTPDSTGVPNFCDGNGAVADVLFNDLQAYLAAGLQGGSFNILKSDACWNSDILLTYNGFVCNSPSSTNVTPIVGGQG
jgi:hypothetical protein